jgi:serine/threonine protein kinase/formylglycine-generating enzyme required for sulfatase activity
LEPSLGDLLARFPDLCEELRVQLAARPDEKTPGNGRKCAATVTISSTVVSPDQDAGRRRAADPEGSGPSVEVGEGVAPAKIGRYRVLRVLGDGGFGRVYLAFDDDLGRNVAIKVPHRYRVSQPVDVEAYLSEARILARLEHHSIVPVYDCGRTDDGLCFAVSKYIEGGDLATKVKRSPFTFAAAAEVVATIADALHCAHRNGIVHRDIKPANILVDLRDRPYLADFGIALKEEDFGKGKTTIGTLPYMSPEQLRGEGHLVDGRSDIFSLGVVLYELLTGRKLFSSTRFAQAGFVEPRPPRQVDDSIPKELERICLKALSFRVADRYSTALDFATDLRDFLHANTGRSQPPAHVAGTSGQGIEATSGPARGTAPLTIVPKGLRSFDRDDAGFFLQLLPGPRDREGLPESVHFWKTRIHETDPDKAFRVGLIYGPSGCGKSSFLKAGVIPLLGSQIISLYVESTPLESETRLLKALRRECPDLPHSLDLTETLKALRRGTVLGAGKKLLIVFDQFEQWLHSRQDVHNSDLLRALRQCDGTHLQCILVVRDDFWMAVTQFLGELEVALVPGENVAAIDLFSLRHAKKVLAAIGQAYGVLPTSASEITPEQKSFIDKSVAELATNDRVAPVHLAVFAEMVKERPWVPATLKEVGGTKGVGVAFLEETFNGRTANPNHRLHQKAARAALRALVSDQAGNIKGSMRHYGELLSASGYEQHPKDFDALLHILDSELRLITPTQPEGLDSQDSGPSRRPDGTERYFHLTHDYLVPSLREWLTSKQKETRRGRAELLLAERASSWNARPTSQNLPSFFEWLNILMFTTPRGRRKEREARQLLRAASRYFVSRLLIAVVLVAIVVWTADRQVNRSGADALVESLRTARTQDVPSLVARLNPVRKWADPSLARLAASADPGTPARLHAAMALLPVDPSKKDAVFQGLLVAAPKDSPAIRESLVESVNGPELSQRLWSALSDEQSPASRRFRAGAALAAFEPPDPRAPSERWTRAAAFLCDRLIVETTTDPSSVDAWIESLRPLRGVLGPELRKVFTATKRPQIDRYVATLALGDFLADAPRELSDLMLEAEPWQYTMLLPRLKTLGEPAQAALTAEFRAPIPASGPIAKRRGPARRRERAAITLMEFGQTQPLVEIFSPATDLDLRTYTEDDLSRGSVHPEMLLALIPNSETPLRAALIRCLAGMSRDKIPESLKERLDATIARLFQTDPDAGVHSAAEWAFHSWALKDRLPALSQPLISNRPTGDHRWYIDAAGHTMAVFPGPIDVQTGSPPDEEARDDSDEPLLKRTIHREFALSTMEVTAEQFLKYKSDFPHVKKPDNVPSRDCPIVLMTWHRAAGYCNWLSKREGIPESEWCYTFHDADATPTENYLHRTGYRLPTDVEWEYACRAGSAAAFCWGNDQQSSGRFAWSLENSSGRNQPVGSLCPNAFGMFDMHGNVAEWVFDKYVYRDNKKPITRTGEDVEDPSAFPKDSERDVRGGSNVQFVYYLRSANRTPTRAYSAVSSHQGFRIARTLKALPASP